MLHRPLDIVFFVQGEGRGHMTQALALRRLLADAGHRVREVFLGRSRLRQVPAFFTDGIDAPVTYVDSPGFATDADNRGVRPLASLRCTVRRRAIYRDVLQLLHRRLRYVRPDLVVSFYEPLWGLYALVHRTAIPSVCLGHQYLLQHPAFRFPSGHPLDRLGLRAFTALTAAGPTRRLALSFYPLEDAPRRGIHVVPPLLREAVFAQRPTRGDHLLVYLLNAGYAADVERWHARHPEVPLHCFWDRADAPPVLRRDDTLTFHRLDDRSFLELMASCRGLVSTAGFESICEAMYLGKPALMVPVAGHFEQRCNALDAARAGAGLAARRFDLDRFLRYLPRHDPDTAGFRGWVRRAPAMLVRHVEEAAGARVLVHA